MAHILSPTGDQWYHTPLSLVGLLALADLDIVARRTALTGTTSWSEAVTICPGLHRQHKAELSSHGEFPACAAMTTGYVFRIENPATVFYLQSISETGKLTNISVSKADAGSSPDVNIGRLASALTILAFGLLASQRDWWAISYLLVLIQIRCINTSTIQSRARVGWHGQSEPGHLGDMFILLSYDRWVRIRGEVDDLKAVTSGRWLQQPTMLQSAMSGSATLLAYGAAALAANATLEGQIIIALTLLINAATLGLANYLTTDLHMKERVLKIEGGRKAYKSRNVLASELVAESGRVDWAIAMGLIPSQSHPLRKVTM